MKNYWMGEKIRLRPIKAEDGDILFEYYLDTQARFLNDSIEFPISGDDKLIWLKETYILKPSDDAFSFIIENKESEIAGIITAHHCDGRIGSFKYGISIAEKYRNRGYAREAIILVLKYYFKELRYQKVTVDIHGFNEISIYLHEKLGFKKEGTVRRVIYTGGKYYDSLIYGLTVEEFDEIYGSKI